MKLLSLFAIFALASPYYVRADICPTTSAVLVLPPGNLTAPTGNPSFVLLGEGYQNYTCNPSGQYVSAGAVAYLFDLACLSQENNDAFNTIQDTVYDSWSDTPPSVTFPKFGEHFFQSNGSGGIAPVWDFRGMVTNQANAFVVGAKVAGLTAPTGSDDVDWLQLHRVSGDLAENIYRTHTRGGKPPASCTPGSDVLKVKYVSKYWLYGGSITIS